MTFADLRLQPALLQAVTELGYTAPTPIQSAVIPVMLAGRDVIGQAQTGTGKTAAFTLPILHHITPGQSAVQALVITPTRELALQVARATVAYGQHLGVRVLPVYGGQPYGRQIARIRKGVDIIVGTPGRLLDLIQKDILDLSQVRHLVLDEADEMLSMGFIEDIEAILQHTPAERQTALFSATISADSRRLSQRYMRTPEAIAIERPQLTVASTEQTYYLVRESDKLAALTRLFEMETITRALVFVRTRADAGELANALSTQGYGGEPLSGDLSQDARVRVLERFRDDQIQVLVATDVAARGLDIDDISHVFNYNLPPDPEVYVHRIGRTGRQGKTGKALTLVTPQERGRLRRTERYTKQTITRAEIPTVEQIQAQRDAELVRMLHVWLNRDRFQREREMAQALVDEGVDPVTLAAAALKMARAAEKQRPIARVKPVEEFETRHGRGSRDNGAGRGRRRQGGRRPDGGRGNGGRPTPRRHSHESGMIRLSLDVGRQHGIRPGDVVGTIAYHADIPGRAIGAIHIEDGHTLVDVPAEYVEQVLAQAGKYRVRQHDLTVSKA